jgi:tetratricopeptide (TPR) repeat protein
MGVVYRARRPDLPRDVALKVIPATDAGLAARFLREAQAAGRLSNHPNIVGVHDAGADGDFLYLAMDLIDGSTFEDQIASGELTPESAARTVATVARAVAAGHDAGILHRDLKPANILIDGQGHVRVADFGLARVQQASAEVTRLTKTDEIVGTPAYMAPEQALGDPTDARADVWGLGATLHHALSGAAPFGGESMVAILHAVLSEEPKPLPPDIPAGLRRIVACCLEKQPERRFPSATALADDLERFLRGEPVTARRARLRRRSSRLAAVAIVTAAAGVAAVGAAVWGLRTDQQAADTGRQARAAAEARDVAQAAGRARGRLQALHAATREPFTLLQASFYGRPLEPEDRDAALAEIRAAADREPSLPIAHTWTALADYFAGTGSAGAIATAAAFAEDDPFPHLLVSMAALSRYARDADLPGVKVLPGKVVVSPFREPPELEAARNTAVEALRRAEACPWWSALDDGAAPRAFVRGAKQLAAREYARAATTLREAREDPLFGPPAGALAGLAAYLAGDLDAATADWAGTGDGQWPDMLHYAGTATLTRLIAGDRPAGGAADGLQAAIALFDRTLEMAPRHARSFGDRGLARSYHADRARDGGEFQPELYRLALADFDAAVAIDPMLAVVRVNRAATLRAFAKATQAAGGNPWPLFDRALAEHRDVIARFPLIADAVNGLGLTHWQRGKQRIREMRNPTTELDAALSAFDRLIADQPAQLYVHGNRGQTHLSKAVWARMIGGDALPHVRAAITDLDTARARNTIPRTTFALGQAHTELARAQTAAGADSEAALTRAVALIEEGMELAGPRHGAWGLRAGALMELAAWATRTRRDPAPYRTQALEDYSKVLAAAPGDHTALTNRGKLLAERGQAMRRRGEDGRESVTAAMADFTAILQRNPTATLALYNRALCHTEMATQLRALGQPFEPSLHAALADCREAVRVNPRYWQAQFTLGHLLELGNVLPEALAAFRAAQAVVPDNRAVQRRIARLEAKLRGR